MTVETLTHFFFYRHNYNELFSLWHWTPQSTSQSHSFRKDFVFHMKYNYLPSEKHSHLKCQTWRAEAIFAHKGLYQKVSLFCLFWVCFLFFWVLFCFYKLIINPLYHWKHSGGWEGRRPTVISKQNPRSGLKAGPPPITSRTQLSLMMLNLNLNCVFIVWINSLKPHWSSKCTNYPTSVKLQSITCGGTQVLFVVMATYPFHLIKWNNNPSIYHHTNYIIVQSFTPPSSLELLSDH